MAMQAIPSNSTSQQPQMKALHHSRVKDHKFQLHLKPPLEMQCGRVVSAAFARFCTAVGELGSLPAAALADGAGEAERTAFWLNLYNALTVHGFFAIMKLFVVQNQPQTPWSVLRLFG